MARGGDEENPLNNFPLLVALYSNSITNSISTGGLLSTESLHTFGFSYQRGLRLDRGLHNEEPEILVTPLDDLVLEGGVAHRTGVSIICLSSMHIVP